MSVSVEFSFILVEETDDDELIQRRVTDDPSVARQWPLLAGCRGTVKAYSVTLQGSGALLWLLSQDVRPVGERDPEISCPFPGFVAMHGMRMEVVPFDLGPGYDAPVRPWRPRVDERVEWKPPHGGEGSIHDVDRQTEMVRVNWDELDPTSPGDEWIPWAMIRSTEGS